MLTQLHGRQEQRSIFLFSFSVIFYEFKVSDDRERVIEEQCDYLGFLLLFCSRGIKDGSTLFSLTTGHDDNHIILLSDITDGLDKHY